MIRMLSNYTPTDKDENLETDHQVAQIIVSACVMAHVRLAEMAP